MISVERILFATDFSESAEVARRHACFLADRFYAELHLLHVIGNPVAELPELAVSMALPDVAEDLHRRHQRTEADVIQLLQRQVDVNWRHQHRVLFVTRHGTPFLEILRYARSQEIDLIVLGTHGRTGLPHVLIGSVAENVVRKAECPVLTVRSAPGTVEVLSPEPGSGLAPAPAG